MPRSPEAVGRAEYAEEIAKVRVQSLGARTLVLHHMDPEDARQETVEVEAFALRGIGWDGAEFFTCVDPFAPEGRKLYAAGEVAYGAILPGTRRCEDRVDAGTEAVKFALRPDEADRPAVLQRMGQVGERWRAGRAAR